MSKRYPATGIILKRLDFNEADRILTIISEDRGKISAIAKGVRKPKSKLAGSLELLSVGEFEFIKGKSLDVVVGAKMKQRFKKIETDYELMELASLGNKLVYRHADEGDGQDFFELLRDHYINVEAGYDPALVELRLKLMLLDLLGNRPEINRDVDTGGKLDPDTRLFFDITEGGITSNRSTGKQMPITVDQVKIMRLLYSHPIEVVDKVAGVGNLSIENLEIINKFSDYL